MNKSIIASLVISTLLAGCGTSSRSGGGSSSTVITTYKWQIVQLKSVAESSLASSCVIYADSVLNEDEVISAYVATEDYNILYHNADGSIDTSIAADEITNGLVTITPSNVPSNGYVTLEEVSNSREGDTGSYMFSVQKSLLSDMVLNIAQDQSGDCYTGDDHRDTETVSVFVNVGDISGDTAYYQSSYDESNIDGQNAAFGIPVSSLYPGDRDILITAFDLYNTTTQDKEALVSWVFVDSESIYETSADVGFTDVAALSSDQLTDVVYTENTEVTLNSDSGIIVIHDSSSYLWQPIYDNSDTFTLAYESSEVSHWNSYFSGTETTYNWLFSSFTELTNETYAGLSTFNVSDIAVVTVSTSCIAAIDFCLDTGGSFNGDDFTYQRVHLRLEEDDGDDSNIAYQSIYSKVNEEPVILENSLFDFVSPTLVRTELNLMKTDAGSINASQYLMAQNIDLVSVGEYGSSTADDAADTDFYNDINGFIATNTESESLYHAILASTTLTLMNAEQP